jgi:hypothetical protein
MKKNIFLFFMIAAVLLAVGFSGCLGNDDSNETVPDSNSSNNSNESADNSSNNSSDNSSGSDNSAAPKPIPPFDANLTLVHPVPEGLTFFSTATVKSHGQRIGITDALFGYQGIYHYGAAGFPVFLTYYNTLEVAKSPDDYIQMMKNSHTSQYGSDSQISTIQVNGHDAVLFAVTSEEPPQFGRYMLAWPLGDMFVTVTGNVDSSVLISLAEATGY